MLPAIAALIPSMGELFSMLAGMGLFEAGRWGAGKVGSKLLGGTVGRAASYVGKSGMGAKVAEGLTAANAGWARNKLPASASDIVNKTAHGLGSLGKMTAGMYTMNLGSELLSNSPDDVINAQIAASQPSQIRDRDVETHQSSQLADHQATVAALEQMLGSDGMRMLLGGRRIT